MHYLDGTLLKGETNDFAPARPKFHVVDAASGDSREVDCSNLKAIFFVKSLEGLKGRVERKDMERTGMGKKIQVKFKDGETLVGYTSGYAPNRPSFFVFPADPESNNERIFVMQEATDDIRFL